MVWWCMYFAVLLKKSMSNILCNFVFTSKDEPCNPHTHDVFLTHGTMLPVWSSDRAHAGRCLAKTDCRFTSSKTAMRLKKQVAPVTWKRDTFAFVDGFFGCWYFPRFNLDMGNQGHLHNLRCSFCNGDPGFGIERSSLFEQWVLAPDCFLQVYWGRKKSHLLHCDSISWCKLFFCSENKHHSVISHDRLRVVLSQDSRANCFRQKSLKRVFAPNNSVLYHATRFQTPARLNLITGESRHPLSDRNVYPLSETAVDETKEVFVSAEFADVCWIRTLWIETYFTTVGGFR